MMARNSVSSKIFSPKSLLIVAVVSVGFPAVPATSAQQRRYNDVYTGEYLNRVAFPLGGIGAGMICIEGTGALSHCSIRNKPEVHHEPCTFSAICIPPLGEAGRAEAAGAGCIKGNKNIARVIEGPVPSWKILGFSNAGNGGSGKTYGLPRFAKVSSFKARFPFATINLEDPKIPLKVQITGWSPFTPPDANNSSLPVVALEYRFVNPTDKLVEAVYSFNTRNFFATGDKKDEVSKIENGFVLSHPGGEGKAWRREFAVCVDDPNTKVNCAWFRGRGFDPLTMAWKDVEEGARFNKPPITEGDPSPGASVSVPIKLGPGKEKTIRLMLSWYVPETKLRVGHDPENCGEECKKKPLTHKPWYSGRFASVEEIANYWRDNYQTLREKSKQFSDCFYDTTLPDEVVEAVSANLSILKSPTILRQADGRLWCWEGCCDNVGCCAGSCTHVWNYAQAIPHLFPELERTLRQTEFNESQDERGHQIFRSNLPIRKAVHHWRIASDGQLGGIMKVYRDWRISGDTQWLKEIWPKVKLSLNYCIETLDPEHNGVLSEPHHNTYDIEFWGPDSMCSSFYLGALKAAIEMGKALDDEVPLYTSLFEKGQKYINEHLFNGEYFYQKIQWQGLRAKSPMEERSYSPEAVELLNKEGPKYQYGKGCLSDGVLGVWMAAVCGLKDDILDSEQIASHLRSVHKYNLKKDLSEHVNPQRPTYALGSEGGLLLCTWPKGGKLSLPFIYSNEVWTGIEYQVASHLMSKGMVEQGMEIVRTCRDRYDGRVRNPFNEYECGHWYARALSSYALLQGLTGARYDAVEKILYLKPSIKGDFRSFLCTATGFATVGLRDGKPFVEIRAGSIPINRIVYSAN